MLPSAAAFVDPLLSTGFPLTLLGLERLGEAMRTDWGRPSFEEKLRRHGATTLFEADAAALLVSALYARMHDFPVFAALTHAVLRRGELRRERPTPRPAGAGGLVSLGRPPGLRPGAGPLLPAWRSTAGPGDRDRLLAAIREAIEPLDVIGLGDASRRNWYPVDPDDLRTAPTSSAPRAARSTRCSRAAA